MENQENRITRAEYEAACKAMHIDPDSSAWDVAEQIGELIGYMGGSARGYYENRSIIRDWHAWENPTRMRDPVKEPPAIDLDTRQSQSVLALFGEQFVVAALHADGYWASPALSGVFRNDDGRISGWWPLPKELK